MGSEPIKLAWRNKLCPGSDRPVSVEEFRVCQLKYCFKLELSKGGVIGLKPKLVVAYLNSVNPWTYFEPTEKFPGLLQKLMNYRRRYKIRIKTMRKIPSMSEREVSALKMPKQTS